MKRILLTIALMGVAGLIFGQTTYYWVGGLASANSITIGSNWNTDINGAGGTRPSSTGATDILVFDGSNLGGATPATGPAVVLANGSITCAQIKFVNNASITLQRASSGGTSTLTISGDAGEDFVIESGSSLSVPPSSAGSLRFAMAAANTGRVSGALSMITPLQCRIDNTTGGSAGSFRFTSGASFTTNITSASSSYAFGSSSQSSPGWVVFEAGSHLYFDGGYSPHGSGTLFSAIDMKPGSTWHHRATNGISGVGNFFNRQGYGTIIVENNATLVATGSIYRIENLVVNNGCTFTTHSSGQTVLLGNMTIDGTLTSPPGTNELLFAGNTIAAGAGTVNVSSMIVADNATLTLGKDISIGSSATVFGRINFSTNKLTGAGTFTATGIAPAIPATGNMVAGAYLVAGTGGTVTGHQGKNISGTGLAANTSIVAYSVTGDSIYLSTPVLSTGSGVALTITSNGATLENGNANGFDPGSGAVALTGNQSFGDNINYVVNAATSWPFGVTTSASATPITARFIEVNAPVTVNRAFTVSNHLSINGKLTLRPLDLIHILPGAVINGTINASNYIATVCNSSTGDQSSVRYDGITSSTLVPVGTASYYLPVTLSASSSSDFSASVFEGITTNGTANGTPLTPAQKQRVVDAVWNINRLSGSGSSDIQLGWNTALEGSTFVTLPSADIGLIYNNGASWDAPVGTGDNAANTVSATVSSFGSFAAGAVPPSQPFTFNPIPDKIYGDADFNGGASSLNTTQPIVYSSDNAAVATIVNGDIHITGAGTATITASQASDGFYPAANATQTLTVTKAGLTIKADDQLKFQNQPNPVLTITYTGFVLGETSAVLLTPPVITTTAVTSSPAGTYPITVSGATAANYVITFTGGILTVQPQTAQTITFNALPVKTYGNADFNAGATSTNSTIPITFTSSNTSVATVNAAGLIHITGGGTTTITASQAGNAGYFPAADVARTLTVNKAPLAIKVLDTTKVQGQPNPVFTMSYTGFVLGETVANLATPPTVSTIATTASPAGYYTLTPEGAVTNNYNITYTTGRLTIYPPDSTANHIHAFMSSSNTLTVRIYSTFPALGDVMLYDLSGRPLLKKNVFFAQGFINTSLNVSLVPAGVYVVTARGSGVNLSKTIVIIK